MDEITLNAFDNNGDLIDEVTLNGNLSYKTHVYDNPLNQITIQTLDGNSHTYGNSIYQVMGEFDLKGVLYSEGVSFKDWLRDDLNFQGFYLGMEIPVGIDLGEGDGVDIVFANKCRIMEKDGDKVAKLRAPKMFDIKFKFKYMRS